MIELRLCNKQDLVQIKEWESHPDNSPYIGQWTMDQHREALDNPNIRQLIIEEQATGLAVGFIILAGLTDPAKTIEFKRIAVQKKGLGIGKAAVRAMQNMAFNELKAHRLWLDVVEYNARAKSVYEDCGFKEEGLLRDSQFFDNKYFSAYVMSILDHEYRKLTV